MTEIPSLPLPLPLFHSAHFLFAPPLLSFAIEKNIPGKCVLLYPPQHVHSRSLVPCALCKSLLLKKSRQSITTQVYLIVLKFKMKRFTLFSPLRSQSRNSQNHWAKLPHSPLVHNFHRWSHQQSPRDLETTPFCVLFCILLDSSLFFYFGTQFIPFAHSIRVCFFVSLPSPRVCLSSIANLILNWNKFASLRWN